MDLVLEAKRLHSEETLLYMAILDNNRNLAEICADYSYQTLDMAFEEGLLRIKGVEPMTKRVALYSDLKEISKSWPIVARYLSRHKETKAKDDDVDGDLRHDFQSTIAFIPQFCNRITCYYSPLRDCTCGKPVS